MTDEGTAKTDLVPDTPIALTTPARRHGSLGTAVFGLVLAGLGVYWLLDRLDVVTVDFGVVLPAALAAVGVALLIGAFDGEHAGLVVVGSLLTVAVLVMATTPLAFLGNGIGERRHAPATVDELGDGYRLGIGEMRIDLTDLVVVDEVLVTAELGIGELRVIVPPNTEIAVNGEIGAGELSLFGEKTSGTGVADTFESAGFDGATDRLVLELDAAVGAVEVTR